MANSVIYSVKRSILVRNKVTISLEPAVFDKLPAKNRSAVINTILKQHYQQGSIGAISDQVVAKLVREMEFNGISTAFIDAVFNSKELEQWFDSQHERSHNERRGMT